MKLLASLVCVVLFSVPLVAAKGTLQVGAARIDITPNEDSALPLSGYASRTDGFQKIHDRLFARAIVLDDGSRQAAIVTWDLIFVPQELWKRYTALISKETGIPAEHILMAATHTHGGPNIGRLRKAEPGTPGAQYMEALETKTLEAVTQARASLQPARVGYGTGEAHVNMNRRARMADGGWWLGYNPKGPSDKTVAVVRFESLNGKPIALFVNYGVHGTVLGGKNYQITSDLPGAASRFVERHFGENVVAAFTAGCSGDQNPIYRVGTNFDEREVLGELLGTEIIKVAKSIRTSPRMAIRGDQRVVTCDGKKLPPGPRRRRDNQYVFLDADPVDIRLSLLMLNHIAIAGISGEVLTPIGTRLKQESPFAATVIATHANGSSGYIPDDASYDQVSYEIVVARVKRGCAEDAIVDGLLDMMDGL